MAHRKEHKNGEKRVVGFEGLGSSGDIRDRFRNVHKPGAHPPPPGFGNPFTQVSQWLGKLQEALKKRRKPTPRVSR